MGVTHQVDSPLHDLDHSLMDSLHCVRTSCSSRGFRALRRVLRIVNLAEWSLITISLALGNESRNVCLCAFRYSYRAHLCGCRAYKPGALFISCNLSKFQCAVPPSVPSKCNCRCPTFFMSMSSRPTALSCVPTVTSASGSVAGKSISSKSFSSYSKTLGFLPGAAKINLRVPSM